MGKTQNPPINSLGDPHLVLAGFSLWVHGKDAEDWLDVTARFQSETARVLISGNYTELADFEVGLQQLERLHDTLSGAAVFESLEPGFKIELSAGRRGQIEFELLMTPGYWEAFHYTGEIDQSYLPATIAQLKEILERVQTPV